MFFGQFIFLLIEKNALTQMMTLSHTWVVRRVPSAETHIKPAAQFPLLAPDAIFSKSSRNFVWCWTVARAFSRAENWIRLGAIDLGKQILFSDEPKETDFESYK
jgi:hypothetical protein